MTSHTARARRLAGIAVGFALILGLVAAQAVGAIAPPPQQQAESPQASQVNQSPKFTKVHAWRSAGGIVDVQVEVENVYSVDLIMPGTITLIAHDTYSWGDVYHFRTTGLVPNTLYNYQVKAAGLYNVIVYNGSVMS